MELLRRGLSQYDVGATVVVADTPEGYHTFRGAASILLHTGAQWQERGGA